MSIGNILQHLRDFVTTGLVVVDEEHWLIHKGRSFETHNSQVINGGATFDYLFVTPNTSVRCHLVLSLETDGKATYTLFEGTTTSANGTAVATFNNARASATTATMLIYHTPTVTATGTQIDYHMSGSGEKAGGQVRVGDEWILAANTKYLLRITAGTNNVQVVTHPHWYEQIDGQS